MAILLFRYRHRRALDSQCIDYAIEHNISIRRSANSGNKVPWVWTMLNGHDPNLNGSAGQSWNWGRTQTAVKMKPLVIILLFMWIQVVTAPRCLYRPIYLYLQVWDSKTNMHCLNWILKRLWPIWRRLRKIFPLIQLLHLQVLFNQELHGLPLGKWNWVKSSLLALHALQNWAKHLLRKLLRPRPVWLRDEMSAVQADKQLPTCFIDLSQLIELETPKDSLYQFRL